jgi:hypothetical protein
MEKARRLEDYKVRPLVGCGHNNKKAMHVYETTVAVEKQ